MDEGDHSDRSPEFLGAEIDRLKRLLIKEQSFSDFVYCELEKCYNYLDKVIDDIQDEHRSHIDDILENRTAVEDKSLELSVLRKQIKQEKVESMDIEPERVESGPNEPHQAKETTIRQADKLTRAGSTTSENVALESDDGDMNTTAMTSEPREMPVQTQQTQIDQVDALTHQVGPSITDKDVSNSTIGDVNPSLGSGIVTIPNEQVTIVQQAAEPMHDTNGDVTRNAGSTVNLQLNSGFVARSNDEQVKCEFKGCSKTFKNKLSLRLHMKIHDPKDIKCKYNCNECFKTETQLQTHIGKEHPKYSTFTCERKCNRGFFKRKQYNEHMEWHDKVESDHH